MKCVNCGNSLSLLEKYCPNCGSLNIQSKKHIDDMEKYEKSFNETKYEVVRNSRWFTGIIAPIAVMVISALFMIICLVLNNVDMAYEIGYAKQSNKNTLNGQSVDEYILELLSQEEYEQVNQLYSKQSIILSRNKYPKSYDLYRAIDGYCELKKSVLCNKNIYSNNSYYKENIYNKIADALEDINGAANSSYSYDKPDEISLKYIEDIKNKRNLILKTNCNLTDDDIKDIDNMSKNEIITVLTRRMSNEN